MYKLFSNDVPRAFFSAKERAFSPRRRKNEDPDSDSGNEAFPKKGVEKKKIIKDRSYERDSYRASTEMYLS